ncbi:GNAT family N-acetyltransferase [Roseateles oligotrophus]|uniref:GNAT family N-acetyltransferase n=1 Tax=Roseateles oligotrophus TaxID=1769250 RepID=A0ABT2YG80_9BURK|nr:GNAT family N-acetyltransferase [Roseateles oligotrophus]MCV2369066.1 GNAT family N-acetyltransferase [Roseateles oligotrophus]
MTTIVTRLAGLHDLDAIASMFNAYRQFYEQPSDLELTREFIRTRLQNSESIILLAADSSGQSAGFCQLYPSFCSVEAQAIYTLYDLFVRPEFRRAGAGKALLLAAHDHAQTAGRVRMDLTTAKTNLAAQALYESLGWVRDEVFLAYNKRVALGVTKP